MKRCSEKFHKIHGKTLVPVSFLIKLQAACNFIKKDTLTQVFSCEFCEISKNIFFTEHFRTTASERVFTRETSSGDEIIPVYGETSLTVYTFLPR